MSKKALLAVGVLMLVMGIAGFIPAWTWASIPEWLAVLKIVIGIAAIYISKTDKQL